MSRPTVDDARPKPDIFADDPDEDILANPGGTPRPKLDSAEPDLAKPDSAEPDPDSPAPEVPEPEPPQPEVPEPESRRSRRGRRRRIRQRAGIVAGALAFIVLVVFAFNEFSGREGAVNKGARPVGAASGPPASLTLFVVADDPALAAVVGTGPGRDPEILPVTSNILAALPQAGSGTLAEALAVSGAFARLGISNVLGTWIDHYVVIDTRALGKIVSDQGGLTVNLPPGARLANRIYPGGATVLTGSQVVEYLTAAKGDERALRWREVLAPLFASGLSLNGVRVVGSDDERASVAALAGAKAPEFAEIPTLPGEGGLLRPDDQGIRNMLATSFGVDRPIPFGVIVLNGTRRPVAADSVAEKLVPAGYRVTAFGPARGINHQTTLVIASDEDSLPQAERMLKILGVGKVFLGGPQSGIGDITVVIGKDAFSA